MLPLISHLPGHAAQHWPNSVAVEFPGIRALTFSEIESLAAKFAGGLAAQGITRGDRVVLHLANSWQWLVAYYAIMRLGAVVIPANILLTPTEIDFISADTDAKAILAPADRFDRVQRTPIFITPERRDGALFFDDLLSSNSLAPVDLQADDLCTIAYTSGTTGKPKGAMLTHGNIFSSVCHTATIHMRTASDRIYSALPFCHVYGNSVLNACFLVGAKIVVPPRFDAGEALDAIAKFKITLLEGVPTMYHQMLAHPKMETTDFSSVTRCTVGGQTMPLPKLQAVTKRFGCAVLELWGMTELGGPAISHSPLWPEKLGSVGLPFPGSVVRIADLADASKDAPIGVNGEPIIRGNLVMRGYWNRPEATRETIDPSGWLATGDIAVMDKDGYVTICDRKKDMIITAGYNIYPAELEQVIAGHPAVAMVGVVGIPDDEKGEIPVAYVVRKPGTQVEAEEMLTHCRATLAAYKVPRQLHFVDALPLTSTGKIARRMLRDPSQK